MLKRKWKKIALWSAGVVGGLCIILGVHIWWVTRPHVDGRTRVMARIDLHQPIGLADAGRIKDWLYRQRGVQYVLVNPASSIAVFSFAPIQNDGNRIVREFRAQLGYNRAERHTPPAAGAGGCPAGY
jgi:hypothetical protein